MRILAKLSPCNKLQIKLYRIADGYLKRPTTGEGEEQRQRERCGNALSNVVSSRKILSYNSPVRKSDVNVSSVHSEQLCLNNNPPEVFVHSKYQGDYCEIPSVVKYADVTSDGFAYIEKDEYERFSGQYRRSLDILKKSQQVEKKHSSWGKEQRPKQFRWQGAEKIREGGGVIDRFVGKYSSSMLTLTLPGGTTEAKKAIASWSGWIVNRILQVMRRVPKDYPPLHWFFVWEHQKRGALHLHMCIAWKVSARARREIAEKVKDKWFQCLLELQEKAGVDCFQPLGFRPSWRNKPEVWQWDYQEITKSVAGYFSKYCQKNSELNGQSNGVRNSRTKKNRGTVRDASQSKNLYYPSRYWGSSASIKAWIKRLTQVMKIETYSDEDTERVYQNILIASMQGQEVEDVIETEFQVVDERNGVCFSSGVVVTFRIPSAEYPAFWVRCMQNVFDRDICMDAMTREFLGEELFASMQ